jgi:hypothetical protein
VPANASRQIALRPRRRIDRKFGRGLPSTRRSGTNESDVTASIIRRCGATRLSKRRDASSDRWCMGNAIPDYELTVDPCWPRLTARNRGGVVGAHYRSPHFDTELSYPSRHLYKFFGVAGADRLLALRLHRGLAFGPIEGPLEET